MKKLLTLASILVLGCSMAFAQSAAGSSKDVTPKATPEELAEQVQTPQDTANTQIQSTRGIRTPEQVENLIKQGEYDQAIAAFNDFKSKSKGADAYNMAYLEMTLYRNLYFDGLMPNANKELKSREGEFKQKYESLRDAIFAKYPEKSDTYLLRIEPIMSDEEALELCNKAVEADPENEDAYIMRSRILLNMKKIQEACEDLEKVPGKESIPEYIQCKQLGN